MNRFLEAQDKIYNTIISELESGHKRTHWIWFIFPQIKGLGQSSTAIYYSIKDLNEAKGYIKHPILGHRLIECSTIVANHQVVFPYPDDIKLKSSMTLFNEVSENPVFNEVLEKYYDGEKDSLTLKLLYS